MPGWDDNSLGYHSDNGKFFCHLNMTGIAFESNNLIKKGAALYPCVGFSMLQKSGIGGSAEINFGHRMLKYESITNFDI
ncbi:4813_t:CDS:2 [Dentiscutata erythropus]|uniref:4813_t:CDS:1 n=1 Tax=Dentiscutata erythropus TaxID=1348616 RepID=A0A9N8WQL4_9GLOM|nr:4813_t:CDS:2 [Dentiscutata erythropus]